MNPITHALVGWCVAEMPSGLTRRQRSVIVLAGIAPDVDGLGIVPEFLTRNTTHPLLWWSEYHHTVGHNLLFAVAMAAVAAIVARSRRALVALLAFISVHLHLLGDLVGARGPDGYDWPIPYLYPFSERPQLVWSGQWPLNAWQNIVITIALMIACFVLAWRRGYSPVELLSRRADNAFVTALRNRVRVSSSAARTS